MGELSATLMDQMSKAAVSSTSVAITQHVGS